MACRVDFELSEKFAVVDDDAAVQIRDVELNAFPGEFSSNHDVAEDRTMAECDASG